MTELVDAVAVGVSSDRLADARALMRRQYDEGRSPMLVAVVARHGKVFFSEAIGDQRPGGPPLSIDSVFPLASHTKPMMAALVLCLVERGLVGLCEPAAMLLPELADEHRDVMVHHLLTHTSGWHDDDQVAAREAKLDEVVASVPDGTDLLTHILLSPGWDVARRLPAGEKMQYCNFNYSLLGEIVRRVTGGTLDAAMRRYLFDPLGMTSSTVIVGAALQARVIERPAGVPFGPDDSDSPLSLNDQLWAASDDGASGVHASAPDLVRFLQLFLDGGMAGTTRVLSADAVRVMTTNQIPGIGCEAAGLDRAEASFGYGFAIGGHEPWPRFGGGSGIVRHSGAGGIASWMDLRSGISGAYFEVVTEVTEFGAPLSWAFHRFESVIAAAVLDG